MWCGRRQGGLGVTGRSWRWCPTETTPDYRGSAHPKGLGLPSVGPGRVTPSPRVMGLPWSCSFQFCQHPRETGGGPGVKGNIPPAWLRLGRGHPLLCMAWGGKLRPAVCMALTGLAQLCLAWLEWRGRGLMGRGWHGTFPWLEELTFCDSKAQKML